MSPIRLTEELTILPEPIQIKKQILKVKSCMGEGGGIDWDSLAVWYGNRIPRYLWSECDWKSVLSEINFYLTEIPEADEVSYNRHRPTRFPLPSTTPIHAEIEGVCRGPIGADGKETLTCTNSGGICLF